MAVPPSDAERLSVQIDRVGNITVLWIEHATPRDQIIASRYAAATASWSTPEVLVDGHTNLPLDNVDSGIDDQGNVFVFWTQRLPSHHGEATAVRVRRYDVSAGAWSTPRELGAVPGYSRAKALCVAGNGEAVILWPSYTQFLVKRYAPATKTWSPVKDLQVGSIGPGLIRCSLQKTGEIDVVWSKGESLGGSYEHVVKARRYDAKAQSWGAETRLDSAGKHVEELRLATSSSGDAMALWVQWDGQKRSDVWASRYVARDHEWIKGERIETSAEPQVAAQLAADDAGNFVAAWRSKELSAMSAFVRRFGVATESWGEVIELGRGRALGDPALAVNGGGDAVVLWHQADAKTGGGHLWRIWTRVYLHKAGRWLPAETISAEGDDARLPAAALEGSRGVAVWATTRAPGGVVARHLEWAP